MRKTRAGMMLVGLALAALLGSFLLPGHSIGRAAAANRHNSQQETPKVNAADLTEIAFASDRDGNFEIYTMDADGGGLKRLTENTAEDFSPVWGANSSRIFFVSTRDGNSEIYVMNADGTSQTRLTFNTADDFSPTSSPTGAKIAFTSRRDGNDEIYSMNPDGSSQVNLTNNPGDDMQPAYSSAGNSIAFASNREGSGYEIYTMLANGMVVQQVTNNTANDSNPTFSTVITFQSDRDGDEEIYTMNYDGSAQTNFSKNAAAVDIDPCKSINGLKLGFSSSRSGDFEIYLANADGVGVPRRLTNNPASDIQPSLQSQGMIRPTTPNTLQFSAQGFSVSESGITANIVVTRSGSTAGEAAVEYATVNGTATDRGDYTPALGILHFNPGETSKSFNVSIIDDAFIEADEAVNLSLRNPAGAILGPAPTAVLTILDNDSTVLSTNPNPIDNAAFFVQAHYRDFLNREPEPAGLLAWVDILKNCPFGDVRCDRIEVSSAFYRSPEFQGRGYFIYRFYSVALGRVPHYAEFVPDLARVSGFQTAAELEASRVAFINDFMARSEFRTRYDALTNAADYVNALVNTAGVNLPNKQALIDDLAAGRKTRAEVLRAIAESPQVSAKFFNEAFVVMEYFGYLHRDPDILYLQWLDLLNRTGDFRTMVNGFVNSLEYRSRFGPP